MAIPPFNLNENEENKQNTRSSQGSNRVIPALPAPAIPIQDLPSALPTSSAGTKGGKQEQKGENFHHLQLYFQFPPGTGGAGVNNHPVGFATCC